jgi:hypothetical protein
MTKQQRISARHALSTDELMFVRIYSAFGEQNAAEAYRRAFLLEDDDGGWFEKTKKGVIREDKPVDPKSASTRAARLLSQDHIKGYIAELKQGAGDAARQQLADAVLFTNDATALKAAEKVLADEDKLGFRDAVERWAEIMCAIGTEVVVPVPGGGEVSFPLRDMFPTYAEALPPQDVIEKTIKTLEVFRDAGKVGEAAEVHGDPRARSGAQA